MRVDLRRFERRERPVAERLLRQPPRRTKDAGAGVVGGADRGQAEEREVYRTFKCFAAIVGAEEVVAHNLAASPIASRCVPSSTPSTHTEATHRANDCVSFSVSTMTIVAARRIACVAAVATGPSGVCRSGQFPALHPHRGFDPHVEAGVDVEQDRVAVNDANDLRGVAIGGTHHYASTVSAIPIARRTFRSQIPRSSRPMYPPLIALVTRRKSSRSANALQPASRQMTAAAERLNSGRSTSWSPHQVHAERRADARVVFAAGQLNQPSADVLPSVARQGVPQAPAIDVVRQLLGVPHIGPRGRHGREPRRPDLRHAQRAVAQALDRQCQPATFVQDLREKMRQAPLVLRDAKDRQHGARAHERGLIRRERVRGHGADDRRRRSWLEPHGVTNSTAEIAIVT